MLVVLEVLCFEFYPNSPTLKEQAMVIKESFQDSSLHQFCASDWWLNTWKSAYAIKESRIPGKVGDLAEETITSWLERIQELTKGYS